MRMITMTLLMIFSLSSCRSFERQVICKEIDSYKIKPLPLCDISFQFSRCRCRCFDYNKWETLEVKFCPTMKGLDITSVLKLKVDGGVEYMYQAVDLPIEACDGISGAFVKDVAKLVRPNIKALNEVKGKLCD